MAMGVSFMCKQCAPPSQWRSTVDLDLRKAAVHILQKCERCGDEFHLASMMLQSDHFIIPLNHNFLIITFKCGAAIMRYVMISGNITMIFSNPGMIFSVNGVILCTFAYMRSWGTVF